MPHHYHAEWRLTPDELRRYAEEGLVRPALRLDAEALARLRHLLDATLAALPGRRPESIVCPHIAAMNGLDEALAAAWLAVATDPRLVDLVAQVLGPDVILWGSQVFCKPAGTGLAVPWHQDGHFWPIRPLATATVWLAIDDVTAANGAMRYIPGSHRARTLFEHGAVLGEDKVLNAELAARHVDLARAETDDLPAGGLSLHDVFLIHGSEPNRSPHRRAALALRFMPATSHYDRALARAGSNIADTRLAERVLYLVRGQDRTGKTGVVDTTGG